MATTNSTVPVLPSHSVMYTVLSSMTYLIICVAVIFLLLLILLLLLLLWYWCFKPTIKFNKKTFRYSSLHSDDEDDRKIHDNKRRLLFSDIRNIPASTHTRQPPHTVSQHHWINVPANPNIDVNAGHLLLSYIENNLRDKGRIDKEWESLLMYQPDDVSTKAGLSLANKHKNRYPDLLPYDHNRVLLKKEFNTGDSDYINASFIIDVDPHCPKYIATQGPMQHTITDFWQMVWEQSINVIVMLTPLSDIGVSQSSQYWPSNGVANYHNFEIRLVSEHRHNDDYIVRSFCILNNKVEASRTLTQFHFLAWSVATPPANPTSLLEFWRSVKTAYTLPQSPLLVHCSEGVGRTGTYILIDMTLSRITSGAKEINLAGAVEHLRDQRVQMVKTKAQFEFALDALVQETQNMLNAAQKRSSY